VWSWRGTIGKTTGPDGERRDEKGPISDLGRLALKDRLSYACFDRNVHTNRSVAAARTGLSDVLVRDFGASVRWVSLPVAGVEVNGVDDLLAVWGPERVLTLFAEAEPPVQPEPTQAQLLVELASDAELLHTPDGEAYATVAVDGHRETWPIKSKGFRQWILRKFHRRCGKPPGSQALQDALGVLEAKAQYEARTEEVFTRVARDGNGIYIDLCNDNWEAVAITTSGWQIVPNPQVRFRRAKGMQALPRPVKNGTIDPLRALVNIGHDHNWVLLIAWLVAAFRPTGPYPILIVEGEQGSCKSTLEKIIRRLIDPSVALVRTPPRDERDLVIAANNSWVIAYDNVSGMPLWLSDALCRLATGAGLSTRQLYTDADEVLFSSMRPVVLNGIDHIAHRPDLADRAIIVHLPPIDAQHRRDERSLYGELERHHDRILGALLDAVVMGLQRLPHVKIDHLPRMADFAVWATAAEAGFGLSAGTFMRAYVGNRADAVEATLEDDPVATAILALTKGAPEEPNGPCWSGTCAELVKALKPYADDRTRKSRAWPANPRAMSSRLRRLVTFLREASVDVALPQKATNGSRILTISRRPMQDTATNARTEANLQSSQQSRIPDGGDSCADATISSPDENEQPLGARLADVHHAGPGTRNGDRHGASGVDLASNSSLEQEHVACHWCGSFDQWQDRYGNWECARCHPPAPDSVAKIR
jgi:hypothetical protein